MTRKDFVLIARSIRDSADAAEGPDLLAVHRVAKRLADDLRRTNPHFDRERFLTACGF